MKKLLFTIAVSFMLASSAVHAHQVETTIIPQMETIEPNEDFERGHRVPPVKKPCVIDFDTKEIKTSVGQTIFSYELWDEGGEGLIAEYAIDSEMVTFLESLEGCFQLSLITDDCIYIGYLEL